MTFPVRNAALPNGPIQFAGQATDDIGVASVRIALKRVSDNRWWSGGGGSGFGTTYVRHEAVLATPDGTTTGWTWDWTPREPGLYSIIVEARDAAGNVDSSKPNVPFEVTSAAPDDVAPETEITSPDSGATVPTGTAITGTASDDTSVSAVRLTIRDGAGQYWTGSAWSVDPATVDASLTASGTAATWSYAFEGSAGSYTVEAAAADLSGNADATPATRSFTFVGSPDTTPPTVEVTAPTQVHATGSMPSVTIGGTVADDVGAMVVRIAIQDTVSKQWWTGSGWGAFRNLAADLDAAGTAWSYEFAPPSPGRYGYQVSAVDGAGNVSAKTRWRTVTMQ
jgi:hypothetical protein